MMASGSACDGMETISHGRHHTRRLVKDHVVAAVQPLRVTVHRDVPRQVLARDLLFGVQAAASRVAHPPLLEQTGGDAARKPQVARDDLIETSHGPG